MRLLMGKWNFSTEAGQSEMWLYSHGHRNEYDISGLTSIHSLSGQPIYHAATLPYSHDAYHFLQFKTLTPISYLSSCNWKRQIDHARKK